MVGFRLLRNRCFGAFRQWSGRAVTLAIEDDAVGAVAQSIEGSCAEQPVGGGVTPLREVEVAGNDGGGALVALRDQVMQVLVVR